MTLNEAITFLFKIIKQSDLCNGAAKISGGVYKLQRPLNSVAEDIVINSLPLNNAQLQEGLFNVNVFVPNLSLQNGQATDNTQPNTARLAELETIGRLLFADIDTADAEQTFSLQQVGLFEDTNNQHYLNFRIDFYSINF